MNNKLIKLTAIILMIFMLPVFSALAEDTPAQPEHENTQQQPESSETTEDDTPSALTPEDYRDSIVSYYQSNSVLTSWWDVVALYGAGADLSSYTLPEWTTETLGETATVTDYAGIIFGLIASGQNVHDIWDRDIADELAKKQDSTTGLFGAYPNQQVYSMLALDAAKEPYNRDAALTALIDTFCSDNGGFGYLPFDPAADPVVTPDVDITSLALLLLDETEHADIIASSVTYLTTQQLENGGFASWGIENSNSLEAVISSLATLNLLGDDRFIKSETSLADVLSAYILENGMLTWEAGSTDENLMATQQGLIAYGDIIAGKSVFLRLTSNEVCSEITANVRVEGITANILDTDVTTKGYDLNLVDAIKAALDKNSIPYIIEAGEYGAYIKSINSETAGKFGGWDGWLVVLNGQSLSASADTVSLTENDEILLYYGMFEPQTLIPTYTLSTDTFKQNTSFNVTVNSTYFDYTTSQNVTVPVVGATVEVGALKFTTNENGVATVTPTTSGSQMVKIYKENIDSYPSIVRIKPFSIDVASASAPSSPQSGGSPLPPTKSDNKENAEDAKPEEPDDTENTEKEAEKSPEITLTYNDSSSISGWAIDGVKKAVAAGLFKGDTAGNINPQAHLSRAELATILLRLTDSDETEADVLFEDINPDDWFYKSVCTVYKLGFMTGTGETSFSPDNSVTREQAAVVLARILKLSSEKSANYADSTEISNWAKDSVNALAESGIMEGSDGKFNPQDILTREMCAVIMARALEFIAK